MAKIVLIGSSSELGNATAVKFLETNSSLYKSIIRVGRESKTSDITWDNSGNLIESVENAISAARIRKDDLIILALGSLCEGITPITIDNLDVVEISKSMEVTGLMTSVAFLFSIKALAVEGGGGVIVFSSVASSPVLTANLFYGASKKYLDSIVLGTRNYLDHNNIKVSLVKPGFVATKMNSGRKPTTFSTSREKVAKRILAKFPNQIIYVPSIFMLITFLLERSKVLRKIANSKIQRSYYN
jgi:short-subunit dehydrogenase